MIVSLTIVRYRKAFIPFALMAMAVHRLPIRFQKGCTFWRLLGSGKNGSFDLQPDWQQWGLLACWDNREDFDRFYEHSFISSWWRFFKTEQWTILCEPLQSHGKWSNKEPFGNPNIQDYHGPMAILTRATIRLNRLTDFWANVDQVSELTRKSRGYITSFGIGERPVYKQATFSVWDNLENMKAYAYRSKEHSEVIRKTREEDWYSEELFARFKPIASMGTLNGSDPLKGLINFDEL